MANPNLLVENVKIGYNPISTLTATSNDQNSMPGKVSVALKSLDKHELRKIKQRAAAQLSRDRKVAYEKQQLQTIQSLNLTVDSLQNQNQMLVAENKRLQEENFKLKQIVQIVRSSYNSNEMGQNSSALLEEQLSGVTGSEYLEILETFGKHFPDSSKSSQEFSQVFYGSTN